MSSKLAPSSLLRRVITIIIVTASSVIVITNTGCRKEFQWQHFSQEETEWLRTHRGKIILSPCPDYPPIDFTDEQGKHSGLAADYMKRIESILNFKFIIVHQDNWNTVMEKAKKQEIDGVISIQKTPEREEYLYFTEPFVQIPNIVIARSKDSRTFNLQTMKRIKISVVKGYAVTEYIKEKYPHHQYHLEPNELTCLMNVSFYQVDAAIVSLSSASYFIEQKGISNLRIAGNVGYDWKLTIATRKDMPMLNALLNKALRSIPVSERETMYRQWISLSSTNDIVLKRIIMPAGFFAILVLLGITTVLVWNRTLRKEVRVRTAELDHELAERKKAERTLAAEKERILVTLKSIGDGVISTDTEWRILLINTIASEFTGWDASDAVGRRINEVFVIRDCKTHNPIPIFLEKEKSNRVPFTIDGILISKSGKEHTVLITVSSAYDENDNPFGNIIVFRDITERQRIEEELNKVQKLESLGVLSGGIAHDFNNILTAILGNANLLEFYLARKDISSEPEKFRRLLKEIEKATLRAKELTAQLLTFSKGGKPVKKIGDLRKSLIDTVVFALRGTNVIADFKIADEFLPAEFDEAQISQVFHNLAINAQQAMQSGGTITVEAEIVHQEWSSHRDRKKGDYVKIVFRDSGIGIPHDNLTKIFDPFFTTKEKGSGLGLASAFSIVRMHGGYIDVQSKFHEGSVFTIYLPASAEKYTPVEAENQPELHHASGTILIMDDEESIRDTLKGMLEFLGYRVLSASHGQEAIKLFKDTYNQGEIINAVILDLTIPGGMGGRETVQVLKKLYPNLTAIASSGYSQSEEIGKYLEFGFSAFIPKPFRLEDISEALHKISNTDSK